MSDLEKPTVVLLPSEAPSSSRASALANSVKSVLGSGVMALPFAFAKTGLIPGIILTLSISWLSFVLNHVISQIACLEPSAHTIDEVYQSIFGVAGRVLIGANVILHQLLACTAYIVFIGVNVSDITDTPSAVVISCLFPAFALLSFMPTTGSLAPFSFVGNIAIIGTLVVVCVYSLFVKTTKGDFNSYHLATSYDGIAPFLGMGLFMFSGHFEVIPIYKSLGNQSEYRWVLYWTAAIITFVYMLFGILVYLAFGDDTKEMVVRHLGPVPRAVCVILLSSAFFLSLPLKITPAVQVVETCIKQLLPAPSKAMVQPLIDGGSTPSKHPKRAPRFLLWWQYVCRTVLALCPCIFAVVVPDFSFLISLIGSTFVGIFAFSLPPFVYLYLSCKHGEATTLRRLSMLALGVVGTALAVGTTIIVILEKTQETM
eukprot:c7536_g1_i1.p1 GENE.c7536_g1_i1~~c7536_g1_i1.p1  ORF type:complete len:428 (+),score=95.94 c7536_g1_i1:207-1490(+)